MCGIVKLFGIIKKGTRHCMRAAWLHWFWVVLPRDKSNGLRGMGRMGTRECDAAESNGVYLAILAGVQGQRRGGKTDWPSSIQAIAPQ
jgi:hypothetical protein